MIKAASTKDSREFWKLVTDSNRHYGNLTANVIPSTVWENHYSSLYNVPFTELLITSSLENTPSWDLVSTQEIEQLINNLKNSKAPGSDFITAEALKANLDWWVPMLANLFTYIDQSGQIPAV